MNLQNQRKPITLIIALGMLAGGWVNSAQAEGEWYTKIKPYGDVRYRIESSQDEKTGGYSYRDRHSIRARLGLSGTIAENVIGNVRLATGGTEATSAAKTIGDYLTRESIDVDIASIKYDFWPGVAAIMAGKIENPFERVGKNQMIWSPDIALEGIGGSIKTDLLPDITLFGNGGGFWILESSDSIDPMLYAGQVGVKTKIADIKLNAGASYYYYKDLLNQKTYLSNKSFGNSCSGDYRYIFNYMLGEGFLELESNLAGFPVKVYGDLVHNNDPGTTQNTGWITGMIFNKAKAANSWEVEYNYRRVEKDALVGAFGDTTFCGNNTNGLGHALTAVYIPAENIKTNITFMRDQKILDASDTNRSLFFNVVQVEAAVSF